jgi:hypothetical protein
MLGKNDEGIFWAKATCKVRSVFFVIIFPFLNETNVVFADKR